LQKLLEKAIIKRKDAGQGQSTNNWCYKRDMSRELFRLFPCSRAMQFLCRLFKRTQFNATGFAGGYLLNNIFLLAGRYQTSEMCFE
jgi:hypothetical protein